MFFILLLNLCTYQTLRLVNDKRYGQLLGHQKSDIEQISDIGQISFSWDMYWYIAATNIFIKFSFNIA